ncbi:MAG: hypothetical protein LAN62_07635 [Acidobacteriia bacterium]|nr:hypothetical protein [Terriglobia bacterium]
MRYLSVALQYGIYLLEAGLLAYLTVRRRFGGLVCLILYLSLLLAFDGVSRPYILYRYGYSSREYAYFYWLTDVLLTLGAFLLVCAFFRRACKYEQKMWHSIRLVLVFVLILTLAISLLALGRNYDQIRTVFIVEFQQNLYFTCLVLNTLLYILLQQIKSTDDELALLVCGLGIQFAGPAANLALARLTTGQGFASSLYGYVSPLCTLGMLLTWFYALVRAPQPSAILAGKEPAQELVAVATRDV